MTGPGCESPDGADPTLGSAAGALATGAPSKCKTCSGELKLDKHKQCMPLKCNSGENQDRDGGCVVAVCKNPNPENCLAPANATEECEGSNPAAM